MNITKILLSIIIGVAVATSADAANTMCVTNDNTNIILDPSIDGTGYTKDEAAKTWTATFPNYTVSGIATCNSTSGTYAKAYPEYNFDNNHASSEGVYCWCRMTYPIRSAWVFSTQRTDALECEERCATSCGYLTSAVLDFRRSVYGSVGM